MEPQATLGGVRTVVRLCLIELENGVRRYRDDYCDGLPRRARSARRRHSAPQRGLSVGHHAPLNANEFDNPLLGPVAAARPRRAG